MSGCLSVPLPEPREVGLGELKNAAVFVDVDVAFAAGQEERAVVLKVVVPLDDLFAGPRWVVLA